MTRSLATCFTANGRDYEVDGTPCVVICIDGSEPEYHLEAMTAGRMPWLSRLLSAPARGVSWPARCAMPALTNPNNVSIATGCPPEVHGISGNHFLDASGAEVTMTDPALLRAPTVFAEARRAGLAVSVVTAKDKLRRLLGEGLEPWACLSAERAAQLPTRDGSLLVDLVGLPAPDVYSAELSRFVLAAGIALVGARRPDLVYLSLSDYVQHKHAPGSGPANDFYAMIDGYAAQLDALGAVVVLTADHGMSAKSDDVGNPRILYLDQVVPAGSRVVLPITDPYVAHHGALGSFANVHLAAGVDAATVAAALVRLDGVEATFLRAHAARALQLPADRVGDVVVLATADTALGRSPEWHDLSSLDAPLRSHGGFGEADVPFVVNRPLGERAPREPLHNYDAFWVATTLAARAGSS